MNLVKVDKKQEHEKTLLWKLKNDKWCVHGELEYWEVKNVLEKLFAGQYMGSDLTSDYYITNRFQKKIL